MEQKVSVAKELLSPRAIEILRNACAKTATRAAVIKDPRAFLARHDVELPADVELHIYQRKSVPSGSPDPKLPDTGRPMADENLATYLPLREVPAALDAWWRATHDGCPFGTIPYTTKRRVRRCWLWGVAQSGLEWVQDVPGTSWGHWVYTNVYSVCLLETNLVQTVKECLPAYSPHPR